MRGKSWRAFICIQAIANTVRVIIQCDEIIICLAKNSEIR